MRAVAFAFVSIVCALANTASLAVLPTPAGTWKFDGTLAAEQAGAPALVAVTPQNSAAFNGFVSQTVFGNKRTVYRFAGGDEGAFGPTEQGGLSLETLALLSADDSYTVEMLVSLDGDAGFDAQSIFGVSNRATDAQLYIRNGMVQAWPAQAGPAEFDFNRFHHLVFSNDGVSLRAYLDGKLQFDVPVSAATNALNFSLFTGPGASSFFGDRNPARLMHFFLDNGLFLPAGETTSTSDGTTTDYSSGYIALLRVYDEALNAGQVTDLVDDAVPLPVAAGTWNLNGDLDAEDVGLPALVPVLPATSSEFNDFRLGTVYGELRSVYEFNGGFGNSFLPTEQGGLSLDTRSVLNEDDSFSVEMIFSLDGTGPNGRVAVLDVSNRVSDPKLYVDNGRLRAWLATPGPTPVTLGDYHHLLISHSGDRIVTYLNGIFQFDIAAEDANNDLNFSDFSGLSPDSFFGAKNPDRLMHFFLDNGAFIPAAGGAPTIDGASEDYSSGRLALLRLYDDALSQAQAAKLAQSPFSQVKFGRLGLLPDLISASEVEATVDLALLVDNRLNEALSITATTSRPGDAQISFARDAEGVWRASVLLESLALSPEECITFTSSIRSETIQADLGLVSSDLCASAFPPDLATSDAGEGLLEVAEPSVGSGILAVPTELLIEFDRTILETETDIQIFVASLGASYEIIGQIPPYYQLQVPLRATGEALETLVAD